MTTTEDRALALMREAFPDPQDDQDHLRALRTLGLVLTSDTDIDIRPPKPPRGGLRIAPPRVPRAAAVAIPAAVALTVAVVLTVTLLSTSSSALAQKFPIFASASAKPARAALGVFREANVTAGVSRAIHTPAGTGYVIASQHNQEICMAVPGPASALIEALKASPSGAIHIRYVGGCTPVSQAEKKGVVLMIPAEHGRVELVVILPAGASAPVVRSASENRATLTPKDGTVATLAHAPAVLEYEVKGARVSTAVEPNTVKRATVVTPYER